MVSGRAKLCLLTTSPSAIISLYCFLNFSDLEIFQLYASGKGLKSIANELNHRGYTTKTGKYFSTSAIKDILCNPMYVGKILYNQHVDWSEKRRKGRNADPIVLDGQHEGIIDKGLWNQVQQLRTKKSSLAPRSFNGEYLLSGLIQCPQCVSAMVASRTKASFRFFL